MNVHKKGIRPKSAVADEHDETPKPPGTRGSRVGRPGVTYDKF